MTLTWPHSGKERNIIPKPLRCVTYRKFQEVNVNFKINMESSILRFLKFMSWELCLPGAWVVVGRGPFVLCGQRRAVIARRTPIGVFPMPSKAQAKSHKKYIVKHIISKHMHSNTLHFLAEQQTEQYRSTIKVDTVRVPLKLIPNNNMRPIFVYKFFYFLGSWA